MSEFITSDLHLSHNNIWKPDYADRPVSSTEEMNHHPGFDCFPG